jgi:hypothetical protein
MKKLISHSGALISSVPTPRPCAVFSFVSSLLVGFRHSLPLSQPVFSGGEVSL